MANKTDYMTAKQARELAQKRFNENEDTQKYMAAAMKRIREAADEQKCSVILEIDLPLDGVTYQGSPWLLEDAFKELGYMTDLTLMKSPASHLYVGW